MTCWMAASSPCKQASTSPLLRLRTQPVKCRRVAGFSTLLAKNTYNQNAKMLHSIKAFCFFILSNFIYFNVVWCCILCYNGVEGDIP